MIPVFQVERRITKMRWKAFRVIAVAGVAVFVVLVVLLGIRAPFRHRLVVKAYFENAMGLRAGAPVRLAGVDIGSVKSVQARPELKQAPAEVVMVLSPSYELHIPNDSIAQLETAGILGQTFVDIDARGASGPAIQENGVLGTKPTEQLSAKEALGEIVDSLRDQRCGGKSDANPDSMPPKKLPAKNPSN